MYYRIHYSVVSTTTVQVDVETHARLKDLKEDMTFDELFRLYLDLVPPEEVKRARAERDRAYREWQEEAAKRIRASRRNRKVF